MEHRLSSGRNIAVKTIITDLLNPNACRETLAQFWSEQLCIEQTKDGLLIALPLMYPNGIQVVLAIKHSSLRRFAFANWPIARTRAIGLTSQV